MSQVSQMIAEPTCWVTQPAKINVRLIDRFKSKFQIKRDKEPFIGDYSLTCIGSIQCLIQNFTKNLPFVTKEFQQWSEKIFTIWRFKVDQQFHSVRIKFGQTKQIDYLRTDEFPGSIKRLTELCSQLNEVFDRNKCIGKLSVEDQKVVLNFKISLLLKNLSELNGKLLDIAVFVGKKIFDAMYPSHSDSVKSFDSSMIYMEKQKKFNLTTENDLKIPDPSLREKEYNIQVFEKFMNKLNFQQLEGKDGIFKVKKCTAKVCITASIKQSQEVQFDSLIVKKLTEEQQEEIEKVSALTLEANSLLDNRNLLRNSNIGQFFLLKDPRKETEGENIEVVPCVFSLPYEQTLQDYVDGMDRNKNFAELLKIFLQVVLSVIYLNQKPIIHSDLKLSNIMLEKKQRGYQFGNIKLIDFGSAVFNPEERRRAILQENQESQNRQVKYRKKYLSKGFFDPNITAEDIYHQKFDIYGLGKILKKLVLQSKPYQNNRWKYLEKINNLRLKCEKRPVETQITFETIFKEILTILRDIEKEKENFIQQSSNEFKCIISNKCD